MWLLYPTDSALALYRLTKPEFHAFRHAHVQGPVVLEVPNALGQFEQDHFGDVGYVMHRKSLTEESQ